MMTVLFGFLIVVQVISSLLLIGLVLLQKPKSGGMGMAFGAGMGETLFGSQVGNVLTRATIILASVFMVSTIALTFLGGRRTVGDEVTEKMKPPVSAPNMPGGTPMGAPVGTPMGTVSETVNIPGSGDVPETPSASDAASAAGAAVPSPATEAPAATMPVTLTPVPVPAEPAPAAPGGTITPPTTPATKE